MIHFVRVQVPSLAPAKKPLLSTRAREVFIFTSDMVDDILLMEVTVMKNKKLEISSLVVQIIYGILCLIDIVLCLVYRSSYDSSIGRTLAYFVLDFTCVLFVLPAMPIGIILNICTLRKRRSNGVPRKGWMIWTILSPVVYIVCFFAAIMVFVATTGGV